MRRKRDPGTRKPLSCPLSKQRMMVCWLTLQILAASPVVNTVFMCFVHPLPHSFSSLRPPRIEGGSRSTVARVWPAHRLSLRRWGPGSSMTCLLSIHQTMPPFRYPVGTATNGVGRKVGLLSAVGAKGAVAEGKERLPNLSNDRDYSQLV